MAMSSSSSSSSSFSASSSSSSSISSDSRSPRRVKRSNATATAVGSAGSDGESDREPMDVGDTELVPDGSRLTIEDVLKDRTGEGTTAPKTSATGADSCMWYENKQCTVPRSCFDCLNTRISSDRCMVDPYGVCVSAKQYTDRLDFRRALPPNVIQAGNNLFPASNTSYCPSEDPYCAPCRAAWSNPFGNSKLSYLRYCRGVGGCVCIQACETPTRTENTIMQRCTPFGANAPSTKTVYMSVAIMAGLCCVFALATLAVRVWVRRSDRRDGRGQPFMPRAPRREPTGPQLSLSGWRSMREKLIETERGQLQGDISNHTETRTDTTTTLSVPVIDNTPGPAVQVEHGEGYRPISPSELAHRQVALAVTTTETSDPRP
ncbi:hypothetical protein P43SY_007763 [Pythium insidiosum]|uniref:Uncharacterized protein n=1 Tax=Pythium insidiosum TaxID=114742 RepID=A0AAD5LCT2_PYTIN|nr:hypothetical protein P43SY_007763 [Pythium insidiosum]